MNRTWQLATAAVVGLLILVLGAAWLGGSQGGVGGPAPTASPSPTATPTPLSAMRAGQAGTYRIGAPFPVDGISVTLGDGFAFSDSNAEKVEVSIPVDATTPAWMTFHVVDEVYPDPCGAPQVPMATPLGPTVDDLVAALRDLEGYQAGPVTDVVVGGRPAKSFELRDAATNACEPATLIYEANGVDTNKGSYQRMVVLDVGGQRLLIRELVLSAADDPQTQTYRDKIDQAIQSITFE